jgi:prepilin-type N-terminal cleavage/methylation domain-containing protein
MRSVALNTKGLSLVELLVAVVILAILSSIAAPGVSRWVESYRVKTKSRQLISDLQLAKMKAVTEKANYQVIFDAANARYYINKVGAAVPPLSQWRILADATNPYYARGVTFTQNFAGNAAVFTPIGEASVGTVTVNGGTQTRTVSVATSGRINIG